MEENRELHSAPGGRVRPVRLSLKAFGMGVSVLVIVGFLVLLAIGLANRAPATGRSGFTRINKPAPQFTLSLFDGGELDLSEYQGQPIVINFWASWCAPCRDEAPLLERLCRLNDGEFFLMWKAAELLQKWRD